VNVVPTPLVPLSGGPSVLGDLVAGRVRWDLLTPFPQQPAHDREVGDERVREMDRLLRARVEPGAVDRDNSLPSALIEAFRARGYFNLSQDVELGGLGLSPVNAFRVVETAMRWSLAAGEILAFSNGIGPGAYAPVLGPGPLREVVAERIRRSAIGGGADTEANGGFNSARTTTATLTEDGDAYLLTGEKVCIGNGPIADFLAVTATAQEADGPRTRLFFVDTDVPGFEARPQELLGWRGVPFAVLRFDGVRVPREHAVINPEGAWRGSPELGSVGTRGRLLIVSAPALAIARSCLRWSREFVAARRIDGRPLGDYGEIKRLLAASAADVFAIETVVSWCLLGDIGRSMDVRQEQVAAKNLTSITCWRLVDRTMSLLGLEGYETAESKGRRGALPFPVERALRDARALRIVGGVDFNLDNLTARALFTKVDPAAAGGIDHLEVPGLSVRNRAHLDCVAAASRQLAEDRLRLARQFPEPEGLFENEHALILVRRIANQLFAMAAVLARAASGDQGLAGHEQALADVYCGDARLRLAHWQAQLRLDSEADHAAVAAGLAGGDLDHLMGDIVPPGPSPLAG
jgi:alkylation response protein AidB-like acyl-CoA dehydrogenase